MWLFHNVPPKQDVSALIYTTPQKKFQNANSSNRKRKWIKAHCLQNLNKMLLKVKSYFIFILFRNRCQELCNGTYVIVDVLLAEVGEVLR